MNGAQRCDFSAFAENPSASITHLTSVAIGVKKFGDDSACSTRPRDIASPHRMWPKSKTVSQRELTTSRSRSTGEPGSGKASRGPLGRSAALRRGNPKSSDFLKR